VKPLAQRWAIALLARAGKPEDIAALRGMAARESFRGNVQPAIDQALCAADPANWINSPERATMLRRWLDGRADGSLASDGAFRLIHAYNAGAIDAEKLWAVLGDTIAGRHGVEKPKHAYEVVRVFGGATTNADGLYEFSARTSGSYKVQAVAPEGYQFTKKAVGADRAIDSDAGDEGRSGEVTLSAAQQTDKTIDFGLVSEVRLGDRVWVDWDADGAQDDGEPGMAGVTVRLLNEAGAEIYTTVTDAEGEYHFADVAGDTKYRIRFDKPNFYDFTFKDKAGVDEETDSDAHDAGASIGLTDEFTTPAIGEKYDIDAGLISIASVGDRVWDDKNADGLQYAEEPGLAALQVTLKPVTGPNRTTLTDAKGMYRFDGLDPAMSYRIAVQRPAGYQFTHPKVLTNDSIDSDIIPATGETALFNVAAYTFDRRYDAGLVNVATRGQIIGPATVPGNSKYTYKIVWDGNFAACWNFTVTDPVPDPGVVTVTSVRGPTYDPVTNTTTETIELHFGNAVPAVVLLQATCNQQVLASKEIVVVKVTVEAPPSGQAFIGGTPSDPGTHTPPVTEFNVAEVFGLRAMSNSAPLFKDVAAGTRQTPTLPPSEANPYPRSGLDWSAKITLTGPQGNRGVDQIRVGFIQHINVQALRGRYRGGAAGTPNGLKSDMESETTYFLDSGPRPLDKPADPTSYAHRPWFDPDGPAVFFDATAAVNTKVITSFDMPLLGVPLTFDKASYDTIGQAVGGLGSFRTVDQIGLNLRFNLDVSAQTVDTVNGADKYYWGESRGTWSFNGNGNVGAWIGPTDATGLTWTSSGAAVTPPASWATLGLTQQDVSGPIFNPSYAGSTWVTTTLP